MGENPVSSASVRYHLKKLKDYLAIKTEMVNHHGVIKEVVSNVDRSWVYYLVLILAGLIALLGLLTNSVAVVIGAMLISPLMGPIISSSLALTIGDLPLARRAFKTIAVSVVLTIVVTAAFSFISPLKDPTAEILARVRPNIFDLFIAVLSGIVGAIALCTKRNYLITATGVAVATAVIPPLSVTGYGLGTGQLMLAVGGFLLFFTNFVAIVLTSDLVFFILGFRTSHVEAVQYSPRKRLLIIATLLILVSIPLVYTLVVDVAKVKEKKRIERVLKQHLNKEHASRLTGYVYRPQDAKLLINASVNTVKFIDKQSVLSTEKELTNAFKRPVTIQLEQVIVASEEVKKQPNEPNLLTGGAVTAPRVETAAQIRSKVEPLVKTIQSDLTEALAPFPVSDTRLIFAGDADPVQVTATLKRDYPVGDDERLLLARLLERSLDLPVELKVTTIPLLPLLLFDDAGRLASVSVADLAVIKQLPGGSAAYRFELTSPTRKVSKKVGVLKQYLIQELKVPVEAIVIHTVRSKLPESAGVTLRIVRR
jgi:uncharacterized hydrophobic protein (TIGR00271 family)